jgi:hypothetical protein
MKKIEFSRKAVLRPSALAIVFSMLGLAHAPVAQEINWQSVDGGGGRSTGDDLVLIGVAGQAESIRMTGANLSLSGGYLPLPPLPEALFKNGFEGP